MFTEEELANEEWRPVVGWEDLYEVSSEGRLRRIKETTQSNDMSSQDCGVRYISTKPRSDGHVVVNLNKNGKYKRFALSHIVAAAFLPDYDNRSRVMHLDGDKGNNSVRNLSIDNSFNAHGTNAEIMYDEDLPGERWKAIRGYESLYEISSLGRIRRVNKLLAQTRVLCQNLHPTGYLTVHLSKNGVAKTLLVHRLVAENFIDNDAGLPMVNHKDEVKTNNSVDNLEWSTAKYNTNYGTAIARRTSNHDYVPQALRRSKPILQYDLDGNLIKTWPNAKEVYETLGYSKSTIYHACGRNGNKLSKLGIAHGYRWSYGEDYPCAS